LEHGAGAYTQDVTIRERLSEKRVEILRAAARHGARNVRHAALMVELEALLGCKVDVATEQGLRPRVRDRVLAEVVPL
jgi:predicted nucleotidyltransferase